MKRFLRKKSSNHLLFQSNSIDKPPKPPSSETKQGQSKLMAALFIHNEGPLQADLDNATKADWQVLQCSALYPLWDYRQYYEIKLTPFLST